MGMASDQGNSGRFSPEYLRSLFHKEPTVKTYLELREATQGGAEFDSSVFRDRDYDRVIVLELSKAGVDAELFEDALGLHTEAVELLCLELLTKLEERRVVRSQRKGAVVSAKLAISDGLVSLVIRVLLDELQFAQRPLTPSLVVLIREQLGGAKSEYVKQEKSSRRAAAISIGADLYAKGVQISYAAVARQLGVPTSTVTRWFPKKRGFPTGILESEAVREHQRRTKTGVFDPFYVRPQRRNGGPPPAPPPPEPEKPQS